MRGRYFNTLSVPHAAARLTPGDFAVAGIYRRHILWLSVPISWIIESCVAGSFLWNSRFGPDQFDHRPGYLFSLNRVLISEIISILSFGLSAIIWRRSKTSRYLFRSSGRSR